MVSFFPNSASATAIAAANAAAAAAISSSTSSNIHSVPPLSAEKANCILVSVYERLSGYFNGSYRFEASDVKFLCYSFAKAVDCAIILNSVPGIAPCLPSLVKKIYDWKKNGALVSALMVVLLSIKNACGRGWFQPADSKELLSMVDEICNVFCTEACPNSLVDHAFETISKIMPKFYPHLKLCTLIASFEAKPGYDILMSDFHVPKNQPPDQKIVLVVINNQNLETSSCIAGPAQVSFLVNGKGVDKRNNASLEYGPQNPTDISKMLKYGINVLQAIGYFDGTYLIAVAYMSRNSNCTPVLKEYIQPVVAEYDSVDSEIIEGPSRISLNCPISLKRIKTPVKGHLCKHHQCFDYDNFVELNSRKPNWRCVHCNQPVCLPDLRIDQNMVKVLEEAGDVTDVIIRSDGSWAVSEHDRYATDGTRVQPANIESETNCEPVDLTMEEDENSHARQMGDNVWEAEDRKPLFDVDDILVSQFLANPPQFSSYTTSDATHLAASSQIGNSIVAPVVDQTPTTVYTRPIITGRSMPRNADRTSISGQVLPVTQNLSASHQRLQTNLLDPRSLVANNSSTMQYQTPHTSLENFGEGMGIMDMDMYQATRAAETSAMQDLAPHTNPHVLNSSDSQQTLGLSSLNSPYIRRVPSQQMRPTVVHVFRRNRLQSPPGGFRPQHPVVNQATSIIRPPSPSLPSAARLALHNPVQLTSSGNLTNHRNPTHANRPTPTENARVVSPESWRSLTGSVPELPSGQSWRPTRRMRGSLSGSEYSAVLNHYMAPSTPSAATTTRSSIPSASDQVSALIANNLTARVSPDKDFNIAG